MRNLAIIFLAGSLLVGCGGEQKKFSSESMIRIARKARLAGSTEVAVSFYKKALDINPQNINALIGLAEAYIDIKLLDAALEYIKKAEKEGCSVAKSSYLRGKIHLLSGEGVKAEKEFLKGNTADSLNALGAVYDERGEHQKAQALYKQVIIKNPSYIDAYNNMGLSLMLCGKYKEAVFYLENACSLPE
jgi:protein O-GlcNAc transferase